MEKEKIIALARDFLHDQEKKIWSDEELLEMLDVAVKTYCEDAVCFHGKFDIVCDEDGVYRYPEDYIRFLVGWNTKQQNIEPICSHELPRYYGDYISVKGIPSFIYDDLDEPGMFRVCPDPVQNIEVAVFSDDYGEVRDAEYGVFSFDYGTTQRIVSYDFIGDAYYVRYGTAEEITDHMALVYYVLYQAYNVDSDFINADAAKFFLAQYQRRVDALSHVRHTNTGLNKSGNFF